MSFGGGSSNRPYRKIRDKVRVEAALKKVNELASMQVRQCTNLEVLMKKEPDIDNKLESAKTKVKVSHEAAISQHKEIEKTESARDDNTEDIETLEDDIKQLTARIQTWNGSLDECRQAANQAYATPEWKKKLDDADNLTALALERARRLWEDEPAVSKAAAPKAKPAAVTTASPIRTQAGPTAQTASGPQSSRH